MSLALRRLGSQPLFYSLLIGHVVVDIAAGITHIGRRHGWFAPAKHFVGAADQHLSRAVSTVAHSDDSPFLHDIHQAAGPAVADPQLTL